MSNINSFEEIHAWQMARKLNEEIYLISSRGAFQKDAGLRDQIRRASVSISSNIAEGFERNGRREFIQFLSIAKASAGEVRSQLFLAMDLGYISDSEFGNLKLLTIQTSKLIARFMHYLQSTD